MGDLLRLPVRGRPPVQRREVRRNEPGCSYSVTHYPGAVALISPKVEFWLSAAQARELGQELIRFADYADGKEQP